MTRHWSHYQPQRNANTSNLKSVHVCVITDLNSRQTIIRFFNSFEYINSTMPQAGIDPPAQSLALPPRLDSYQECSFISCLINSRCSRFSFFFFWVIFTSLKWTRTKINVISFVILANLDLNHLFSNFQNTKGIHVTPLPFFL